MVMNISCKFEKYTYNTLASRGVTRKSLHTAAAAAYLYVIHSIHRMLSGGYNNQHEPVSYTANNNGGMWPHSLIKAYVCSKRYHFESF